MSKYVYVGPSDVFQYGTTILKKDGKAEQLPDSVVEKYTAAGHVFNMVTGSEAVAVKVEGK